jgi:hypothetical protein
MFRNYYYKKNKELREYIKQSTEKSMKQLIEYKEKDKYNFHKENLIMSNNDDTPPYDKYLFVTINVISVTSLISYYYFMKK